MTSTIEVFPILNDNKTKDFYNDIFIKKIKSLENWESEVDVSGAKLSTLSSSNQAAHKKRIIYNYILPISYLIYSFIYTKYFDYQIKKNIQMESVLNFNMYKFFFNRTNPLIKNVNIFFYNEFNQESDKDLNIIPLDKIITNKDVIIHFIDYIINQIKKKNNYDKLIQDNETIKDDLKDCITLMNKIIVLLNGINSIVVTKYEKNTLSSEITSTNTSGPIASEPLKNILNKAGILRNNFNITKTSNSNIEIKKIAPPVGTPPVKIIIKYTDSFSTIFEKMKENIKKSNNFNDDDKNKYNKAFNIYLKLLDKIKDINLLIVKEDFIKESNISLYDIFDKYIIYKKKYKNYENEKKEETKLLESINIIKDNIDDQKEVYDELFKLLTTKNINLKNKNIKNKLNSYLKEINTINDNICKNINDSISQINNFILGTTSSTTGTTSSTPGTSSSTPAVSSCPILINKNYNNSIDKIKSSINNQKKVKENIEFNNFLKLFLISLSINELKENDYINILNHKNKNRIKLESKKIDDIKFIYNNYFRSYKKNKSNNDKKDLGKRQKEISSELSYVNIDREVNKNKNNGDNESKIKELGDAIHISEGKIPSLEKDLQRFDDNKRYIENFKNNTTFNRLHSTILNKINTIVVPPVALPPPTFDGVINFYNTSLPRLSTNPSLKARLDSEINSLVSSSYSTEYKKYQEIITNYENSFTPKISLNDPFIYIKIQKIDYSRLINDKNTEILNLKTDIANKKLLKTKKETQIMLKKNNQQLLDKREANLKSLQTKVTDLESSANTSTATNIDNEKTEFNNLFNNLLQLSLEYEDKIESLKYDQSSNKIESLYSRNKDFIKIIDNINNNCDTYSVDNVNKTKLDISTYFTKNQDIFMDELNKIILKNNFEEIKPFFEEYEIFYKELKDKINELLDNINSGIYSIIEVPKIAMTPSFYESICNNFKKMIEKKLQFKKTIHANEKAYNINLEKNEIKVGKYTKILTYTDNLFIYFIDLLIIIDYLSFFYKI